MPQPSPPPVANAAAADPRWRDLYKIGAITSALVALLVIVAVIAFFIWPYAPGTASTAEILTTLHDDPLGGLMSLDLVLFIIELVTILPLLALYVALKPVNESWALIALVLGLVAVVATIVARPLAEMAVLGDQYATATTEAARGQYLAAGEALLAYFEGTAWMVLNTFIALSGLISAWLMLRSPHFDKTTAYVGLVASAPGLGFLIPVLGPILLFVATIGGVVWYFLVARIFYRLGWDSEDVAASQGNEH